MNEHIPYRTPKPCHPDADPLVLMLDGLMRAHRLPQQDLATQANVSDSTIGSWRLNGTEPGLSSLNRCLDVFGYELAIVRRLNPGVFDHE